MFYPIHSNARLQVTKLAIRVSKALKYGFKTTSTTKL